MVTRKPFGHVISRTMFSLGTTSGFLPAIILVITVFTARAQSQDDQDLIFNTTFPAAYTIGQVGNVTWSGGNGKPVNASLYDGTSELQRICSMLRGSKSPLLIEN